MKDVKLIYDSETRSEMVVISKAEYQEFLSLREDNKVLKENLSLVEFQLAEMRRAIFGSKSERHTSSEDKEEQLSLFETVPQQESPQGKKQEINYTRGIPEKRKPVRSSEFPAHLPRIETTIYPEGIDPATANIIGEEVTEELDYQAGFLRVKRTVRPKVLIATQEDGEEKAKIIIADKPTSPIHKGNATAALLAYIMVSRYVDHLPYYRQVQMFKRQGVDIAASTIDGWQTYVCDNLLSQLYNKLYEVLLRCDYLMADETPTDVLDKGKKGKKNKHKGYQWDYYDPVNKLLYFDYRPSRNKDGPLEILKSFSGSLQTDGYEVYEMFEQRKDIRLLACMDHARRYFEKALSNNKTLAEFALDKIRKLYMIERKAHELYDHLPLANFFEERKSLRQQVSVSVLKEIETWLKDNITKVAPKTPIGKAIAYSLKRWDKLSRYVEEGRYEIGNNLIENSIRPLAIGRKNSMFAGSDAGAKRGAIIYTFAGICKLHGINPMEWFEYVIQRLPDTKQSDLEQMLPHNWKMDREKAMQNA